MEKQTMPGGISPENLLSGEILPEDHTIMDRRSLLANLVLASAGLTMAGPFGTPGRIDLEKITPVEFEPISLTDEEQLEAIADLRVAPVPETKKLTGKSPRGKDPRPSRKNRFEIDPTKIIYVPKYDKNGLYIPAGGAWEDLRGGEATYDYKNKNNKKYRGAYQFDKSTWDSNCSFPDWIGKDPADAPPEVQDDTAMRTQAHRGWKSPWPTQSFVLKLWNRTDYINPYFGVVKKPPKNTAPPHIRWIEPK